MLATGLSMPTGAEDESPYSRDKRLTRVVCSETHVSFWRLDEYKDDYEDHWRAETLRLEQIVRLTLYDDGAGSYHPALYTSEYGWYYLPIGTHDAVSDCIMGRSFWDRVLSR